MDKNTKGERKSEDNVVRPTAIYLDANENTDLNTSWLLNNTGVQNTENQSFKSQVE